MAKGEPMDPERSMQMAMTSCTLAGGTGGAGGTGAAGASGSSQLDSTAQESAWWEWGLFKARQPKARALGVLILILENQKEAIHFRVQIPCLTQTQSWGVNVQWGLFVGHDLGTPSVWQGVLHRNPWPVGWGAFIP